MKKKVFGRKFKRDTNERKALFKNLLTSLVLQERIKTTEAKAKAIRAVADKLITKAKKAMPAGRQGGEHAARLLHPDVNQEAVTKLLGDLAPRFSTRNGGYTRIIKIGKRRVADNAPMVYMEWTETAVVQALPAKKAAKKASSKTTKRSIKKEAAVKVEKPAPVVDTKQKPKSGGFLKQLITRQKKG